MEEVPNFMEMDSLRLSRLMVKSVYDWEFSRSLYHDISMLQIKYFVLFNFDNCYSCIDNSRVKECHRYDELQAYYERCVTEVTLLKKIIKSNGFSLYRFIANKYMMHVRMSEWECLMVCSELEKRVDGGEFPIYADLICDKVLEESLYFSGVQQETSERRSVRHDWEDFSVILFSDRFLNMPYDTDFSMMPVFKNNSPAFELKQTYFMRLVKQLITHVVLFHFENSAFKGILKLHLFKHLPCYSFLLDCFRDCLAEIRIMRIDSISHSFTLYRFLIGKYHRKRKRFLDNPSRSERLYQRLIRGKYKKYWHMLADNIERSFSVDLLLDKSIFTEAYKKTNPVGLQKDNVFFSQELTNEIIQYLSQNDLVNLLLAFANLNKMD